MSNSFKYEETSRGFGVVTHPPYTGGYDRVIQQSSAIGDYEDAFDNPGSSYLWIGAYQHLNREEVTELIDYLTRWVLTGNLKK